MKIGILNGGRITQKRSLDVPIRNMKYEIQSIYSVIEKFALFCEADEIYKLYKIFEVQIP